jgi:hypothetical protein
VVPDYSAAHNSLWLSADLVSQKEIDFRLCLDHQRLRGDYAGLIRTHNGELEPAKQYRTTEKRNLGGFRIQVRPRA